MPLELLSEEQFEWVWCMFLKFPAYSKCITNVNKSIVICCFGNTEISNSLGGELTWSNDELNNIINTYRLRFVYLCVYAIGAILWRPFEWVWCVLLMFPSYSKCITNVNKSIVICCLVLRKYLIPWEESLHGQMMISATYIINTYRLRFVYLCVYAIGAILWRPFEWVWCIFLMFPAYSKCITNVNKSIVICCFGNTEVSNSLGRAKVV